MFSERITSNNGGIRRQEIEKKSRPLRNVPRATARRTHAEQTSARSDFSPEPSRLPRGPRSISRFFRQSHTQPSSGNTSSDSRETESTSTLHSHYNGSCANTNETSSDLPIPNDGDGNHCVHCDGCAGAATTAGESANFPKVGFEVLVRHGNPPPKPVVAHW